MRTSILWLTPQMLLMALDQRVKPGAENSIWVSRTGGRAPLEPSLLPAKVHISRELEPKAEADVKAKQSNMKPGCLNQCLDHWTEQLPCSLHFYVPLIEGKA